MPRKPKIDRAFVQPYADMSYAATVAWVEVVPVFAADYFTRAQRPLLRSYCEHVVEVARLSKEITSSKGTKRRELLRERRDETRLLLAAARSLRITLQAQRPPSGIPDDPGKDHGEHPPEVPDKRQGVMPWDHLFPDEDDAPRH